MQTELRDKLTEHESEIQSPSYARLNLIAPDSYVFFESESGAVERYRGKIWSDKKVHTAGMAETLLMQRQGLTGQMEEWQPFVFHSKDPNISAASIMDLVPRVAVDPSARARIGRIVNWVSWLIIGLLLYIILFDVQIFLTFSFMAMIFFAAASIIIALYYERKRLNEDLVFTCTLFQVAPKVPISRSFIHPVTNDVKRHFWEVIPIGIKSSKITYSKIRGYGVGDMRKMLDYVHEIEDFKRAYFQLELEYADFHDVDPEMLSDDQKEAYSAYMTAKDQIRERRYTILQKYNEFITSAEFAKLLEEAQQELADEQKRKAVIEYLKYEDAEIQRLHTVKSQLEIERDKYQKEAESWMRAANSDVNKFNVTVAAKLAKIIKEGALVELYEPEKLDVTNSKSSPLSGFNGVLLSGLVSILPFVVIFVIGMQVYNSIKTALSQMGSWASLIYILVLTFVAIAGGIFMFNYVKYRVVDSMKNTSGSQKVVQR